MRERRGRAIRGAKGRDAHALIITEGGGVFTEFVEDWANTQANRGICLSYSLAW